MLDRPTLDLDTDGAVVDAVASPAALDGVTDPARRPIRFVEVAVDAVGGGGSRTYTYAVPERLADLETGEAVLVDYGRRQALGIVLGAAEAPAAVAARPIADRIRTDGPLLPPLTLELARWVAAHYLPPPALVLRAMLPPGMLERLELMAEARPVGEGSDASVATLDPVDRD